MAACLRSQRIRRPPQSPYLPAHHRTARACEDAGHVLRNEHRPAGRLTLQGGREPAGAHTKRLLDPHGISCCMTRPPPRLPSQHTSLHPPEWTPRETSFERDGALGVGGAIRTVLTDLAASTDMRKVVRAVNESKSEFWACPSNDALYRHLRERGPGGKAGRASAARVVS